MLLALGLIAAACTGGDEQTVVPTTEDLRPGEDEPFQEPPTTEPIPETDPVPAPVEYDWEVLSSGAGGFVTGLDSNADGSVRLARTDVGGIYRWNEGERRWDQLLTEAGVENPVREDYLVEAMAIAPSDPSRLYISTGGPLKNQTGRILISRDTGETWTASEQLFNIHANGDWRTSGERLAVHPNDPDLVLLATRNQGLWRSTDGATTFEQIDSVPTGVVVEGDRGDPAGILFVVFDPSSDTAWAGVTGEGLFRSTDAGVTWTLVQASEGLPFDAEFGNDGRLWVVERDPGRVLQIVGETITDVTPNNSKDYETVSVDAFDPDLVLVGGRTIGAGSLWRTSNGGADWDSLSVQTSCEAIPWLEIYPNDFLPTGSIRFDRQVANQVWVPEGFGIWRGVDNGSDTLGLECESEGVEELVSNDVVVPPGGEPVTAHWDRGIFWHGSTSAKDAVNHPAQRFNTAWDLDWTPADPNFVVSVIGDQRGCCRGEPDSFLSAYSEDGGESWTPFASYESGHPEELIFGNIAVAANDTNNLVWLPSFNNALHTSKDRGATWQRIELPGTSEFTTDSGNYAGGSHQQYFLNRKVLVADRVLPNTFYLYHQRLGLFVSTDGGTSWELKASEGLPVGWTVGWFNATLVSSPTDAEHLIFSPGILQGDEWPAYESTDGGDTWRILPGTENIVALGFGAPVQGERAAVYASGTINGTAGVWRSIDGLETWELITTAPGGNYQGIKTLTGDLSEPGTIYIGFTGTSFMVGSFAPIGGG